MCNIKILFITVRFFTWCPRYATSQKQNKKNMRYIFDFFANLFPIQLERSFLSQLAGYCQRRGLAAKLTMTENHLEARIDARNF